MRLYQMMFGRFMKPADDGTEGGGGSTDRGDSWGATETPPEKLKPADTTDDDVETATGKKGETTDEDDTETTDEDTETTDETTPRDKSGKFAKKDTATIPKSRFDEAVRKEREGREIAERRLAELERQQAQIKSSANVKEMEDKVKDLRAQERKAIVAGEEDKAAALSEEADRLNRQIAIHESSSMTATAKEQALEDMRFDVAVESIKTQYPALDDESEEFDQDLVDDVLDKQRGFMERERLSPSKALQKATKYVMDRLARQAAAEPDEDKGGLKGGQRAVDRKKAAVEKNLDASKRQAGTLRGVGVDSDKAGQTKAVPEAADMTYEEFDALPAATKAKMRGDLV